MGGRQPTRDLDRPANRLTFRDRRRRDDVAQRAPFQQLGDEVRPARLDADVEDREDVGMVQRRRCARLELEAAQPLVILRRVSRQHLDCDLAAEPRVFRAIDLTHAAVSKRSDDFVRAETRAGSEHQCATPISHHHLTWRRC